jgi:GST-like protein
MDVFSTGAVAEESAIATRNSSNSHLSGRASLACSCACGVVERADPLPASKDKTMIDLHYWTTPNGHKITIFLEETALPYKIFPVNIGKGEQFQKEFLKISPNNRIPAMVDHDPPGGGAPVSVFESGAMLLYLAEKTGQFIPKDLRGRTAVLEWLFWQMANLGPNSGQNNHFSNYAVDKIPYAMDRYRNEVNRLYGVLNRQLEKHEYVAGAYSIADMASYPWIVPHERQGQNIADFPHIKRWLDAIKARPAVERAYAKAKEINPNAGGIRTAEERAILFGQTAASVAAAAR